MQPLPEGRWGLPPEILRDLPGYGPDIAKSREKARAVMAAKGYGPNKPLKIKVSTRNLPTYRDASVVLMSQLKEIYIDAELQLVDTAQWVPKLIRRDYVIAVSQVGNGVDDPDQNYLENYACGSRTYMDYCNKDLDAMIAAQWKRLRGPGGPRSEELTCSSTSPRPASRCGRHRPRSGRR